jgi:hypothetical protein
MSKSLCLLATAGLACLWTAAAVADGPLGRPPDPQPPSGLVDVSAGGENLTVWPYTTDDFETPSDPVNLVFPNADPREIRQELMKPKGPRGIPFSLFPFGNCKWTDAMGYEQAAFGRPERWVGGAVQLACVHAGAPLGDPFRFHVRLFRVGKHTIGNAHFEVLITGTAEHQVLSWDFARALVAADVASTGTFLPPLEDVPMIPAGSFRTVLRIVYDGIVGAQGGVALLQFLGLYPPPGPGDVPIPTNGNAVALSTDIEFEPQRTHTVSTTQVTYSVDLPKPFCGGPSHFVRLRGGPLLFTMSVSTSPSGRYERTFTLGGTLEATPLAPVPGAPVPASVFEIRGGVLDDRSGQVTEKRQQSLLGDPFQAFVAHFLAGEKDRFVEKVVCGTE